MAKDRNSDTKRMIRRLLSSVISQRATRNAAAAPKNNTMARGTHLGIASGSRTTAAGDSVSAGGGDVGSASSGGGLIAVPA